MSRRTVTDPATRRTFADAVPTYKGPHYGLDADLPIPGHAILAIRRAVTLSCIKTQTDFLAVMFEKWEALKRAHPNNARFDQPEFGNKNWQLAHRQVCEALAKAGDTPDLFIAYKNHDHASIYNTYTRAVQSIWGAA